MATLQNIRNKGVLLIVIIGLALAAFILGDFLKSGKGNSMDIASIAGNDILYTDFNQQLNELTEIYKMNAQAASLDAETTEQVRENVWNNLVRENVMMDSYEDLGIAVSDEEMFDMVQGDNPHQIVRQLFGNPQNGTVDKTMILQFLKSLDQNEKGKAWWLYMEKEILSRRKIEKYNSLIAKGLYVNTKEAEISLEGKKTTRSIEFAGKTYASVADSTVSVSDSDIRAYYNSHIDLYKQDESRDIEYISFPITASDEDNLAVKEWMNDVKGTVSEINKINELAQYIKLNSDESWDGLYIPTVSVEKRLQEFVEEGKVGDIYGPYFENDAYKLVKLASKEDRPDSVKVSHIVVRENTEAATIALADSIFDAIVNNKAKLATLAQQYSKDTESALKSGDLGWLEEGEIFSECFENKKGEVLKLTSPAGIHIVMVADISKKSEKVRLAKITRIVEPGTETYRDVYAQASKFIGENNTYDKFQAGIKTEGFSLQKGTGLVPNQRELAGIENSRDAIRWAYNSEVGDLSPIFEYDDQFVIAALTKIKEEGTTSLEDQDLVARIKREVIKEKKSAMLAEEIIAAKEGSESLASLAQKLGETVKSAENLGFNSFFVPGAGYEPGLVGAALVVNKDQISNPVKGEQGVYVFRVLSENEVEDAGTIETEKKNIAMSYLYRIMQYDEAFNALKENAEIEDNRSVFF